MIRRPQAECLAAARRVLDQALADAAADYAAGRMGPERATAYERLAARHARRPLATAA